MNSNFSNTGSSKISVGLKDNIQSMTVSNACCAVCKEPARYKAPKTGIPYCSVVCFRQLPHSSFPLLTTSESCQTANWEVDAELEKQFLQLAQSTSIQEFLQDKNFRQELQRIAEATNPLEKLVLARSHEKFMQFERVVFSFFNIDDDQV
ncbi:hypothetical protein GpartN1_g5525.t1 [Galdieria partita]|uniref:Vps72/YL1 C-terminal domain-containing protein n=1 Tax=Galdieria partita TaxID=83374 RepID=A0A9C7PYX2_9RHOD|nr:hypothetical protein GpartN1_g3848.t1 [Galdieria partita]GJQ13734.1 hypothetical protein GpartN1_g5525.t1 [Galdieria partita]